MRSTTAVVQSLSNGQAIAEDEVPERLEVALATWRSTADGETLTSTSPRSPGTMELALRLYSEQLRELPEEDISMVFAFLQGQLNQGGLVAAATGMRHEEEL